MPIDSALRARLTSIYPLLEYTSSAGSHIGEAAVMLLLTQSPKGSGVELVLTRRATHLRSHAGEVSFAGGKWEPEDASLVITALREAEEEIGLAAGDVELISTLPCSSTRRGMQVTPFVGWVESIEGLVPNLDELDCIFTVPLSYLQTDPRVRTDVFTRGSGRANIRVPVYEYGGFTIWGFTAAVIVEFLNAALDARIDRHKPRPDDVYYQGS